MKKSLAVAIGIAALASPSLASAAPKAKDKDTHVQLLAINDFHGNLAPVGPGSIQVGCCNPVNNASGVQTGWTQKTVPAGGIEYLTTHMKALRAQNPNTIEVGAGDLIGASPLVSALFHDEPTIEGMNLLGLQVTGVGNHEFDEGVTELQRMQYGTQRGGAGAPRVDGGREGPRLGGSLSRSLAANVFCAGTNQTIFPPYQVRQIDNTKIAFIGLTFE